mgnify:FL=1
MDTITIDRKQFYKTCKRADFLHLHRLLLLMKERNYENFHATYHAIIADLIEDIYKREERNPTPNFQGVMWFISCNGTAISAFGKDDPIFKDFPPSKTVSEENK